MTNYDPYEQDREDNAVGQHDEDFGQREAYNWEWEPDALDRKNRLINAQRAIATYQAMNPRYPRTVTSHQWVGAVGIALLIIAFVIAALMIPAAHGQEILPTMEQPSGQTDSRPDNRPDMPEPHVAVKSAHIDSQGPLGPITRPYPPYWDRTNRILASSMVLVGSFDLAQTCHSIANGGRELWMPMKTCPQLVGVGVAMGLGMTYLSYQLHRHGHYKLERLPFIGMIAGNTAGIAFSKRNGAW